MNNRRKEDWRRYVEALVRMGVPFKRVKRFEVLVRGLIRCHQSPRWPLVGKSRADAFFAAAVISKVTGRPVERIRFVTPDEAVDRLCGQPGIMDHVSEFHEARLAETIGDRKCAWLRELTRETVIDNAIFGSISRLSDYGLYAGCRMIVHYLAAAAVAGDNELFDALGSLAVCLQEMVPRCQDPQDPLAWYVAA